MSGAAVVLGIGHPLVGDDGIGPAVARELAAAGLEARVASDASALLPLLAQGRRVVIVDAVVGGGAPGTVLHLTPTALAASRAQLSSHGLGVADALEVARALYGDAALAGVDVVAVVIAPPPAAPRAGALSAEIAAAVRPAAALARDLALSVAPTRNPCVE
jgi:hydrogenase maturation protease